MRTIIKRIKSMDYQRIIIGTSTVFSILTAILGYEKLSISYAIAFTMLCALTSICKDLKELSEDLKK